MARARLDISDGKKRCPQCTKRKPLTAFSRTKDSWSGRAGLCRICKRASRRASREKLAGMEDLTARERFEAKIKRINTGCWIWRGAMDNTGHGLFQHRGTTIHAHIAACRIYGKSVPVGKAEDGSEIVAYTTCRVPCCVNFEHVAFCGRRELTMRFARDNPFVINAKREACIKGHPFTPENTHWLYRLCHKGGLTRMCLKCYRGRAPATRLGPNTPADAMAKRVRDLTKLAFKLTKSVNLEIRADVCSALLAELLSKHSTPTGEKLKALVKAVIRQEWKNAPSRFGTSIDEPLSEDGATLVDVTPDQSIYADPSLLLEQLEELEEHAA